MNDTGAQERSGKIFINLAFQSLRAAADNRNAARFAESVNYSAASIEYSFKALSRYVGAPIKNIHDVAQGFEGVLQKLPALFHKELFGFIEVGYTINQVRQLAEYGLPDLGVSPDQIYSGDEDERWADQAKKAYAFANSAIRARILCRRQRRQPRVAVLDGTVTGAASEVSCGKEKSPWTKYSASDWIDALRSRDYGCEQTPLTGLGQEFDIAINPFGEEYPESFPGTWLAFSKILTYIGDGGIFVQAGGLPFWSSGYTGASIPQEMTGRRQNVVVRPVGLVQSVKLSEGVVEIDYGLPLTAGLYGSEFGGEVTGGEPVEVQLQEAPLYAEVRSRDFTPRPVRAFRATVGNGFLPLVPVFTAQMEERKANVVVCTPYKAGCLVAGGLDLDNDTGSGFETVVEAVARIVRSENERAEAFRT